MKNIPNSQTKDDHLNYALDAQANFKNDHRFFYEPLFATHPNEKDDLSLNFLGKKMNAPLWVSSMTGGGQNSALINKRLATTVAKYGLGMGLGSCRPLLDYNNSSFEDFNLRPILGKDILFYANIGIAQVEQLISKGECDQFFEICEKLDVDGIIVHINILQEFFQKEGDRVLKKPIDSLIEFKKLYGKKIIIKEVGQGFGPKSLQAICDAQFSAIDTAGFGGTNFTSLEGKRDQKQGYQEFQKIGHSSIEMINFMKKSFKVFPDCIISGGMSNILDAYYANCLYPGNSVIAMASGFLKLATESQESLDEYVSNWIELFSLAQKTLTLKEI